MSENLSFAACQERNPAIWAEVREHPEQFRVLTGERPTGALHVGHYFGTLKNRLLLQDLNVDTMIVVADYQVLTDRHASEQIAENVRNVVLDYLAVGLDPMKPNTTIFCHSTVANLNQLLLPFLSLVTVSELNRNPTVKDEIAHTGSKSVSGMMFTYPVHQAADILFCRGNLVPGGKDQLPHVELARSIARRFNDRYGGSEQYFRQPELLLSDAPLLLGLDGRKMGKSMNNAIFLSASEDETARLIRGAKTDSERAITYDPDGRPEVSNLLLLASLCLEKDVESIASDLRNKGAGGLKALLTEAVNEYFRDIRKRREQYAREPGIVETVLTAGKERADELADETMDAVRRLMKMRYF